MKLTLLMAAAAVSSIGFSQSNASAVASRFGGPTYTGGPALDVTASLVQAGGGPQNFMITTALTSMVGEDTVKGEVASLTKRYGEMRIKRFVEIFNFAVNDAIAKATAAGVSLPAADLSGKELATALVKAGMDEHGTFWTCFLLDKALTHGIHVAVMDDIDKKFGFDADQDYHRISNQAHYDLGKALGVEGIKRASLH